jgi:hypothetical protein
VPNYQRAVLLISAGGIEGDFVRKNAAGMSLSLFDPAQCPGLPGICNPEQAGLPGLQCLDHPPYSPDLAPSLHHLFRGLQINLNSVIILPTPRALLPL